MPVIKLQTLINAPVETCFNLSRSIDVHLQSMQQHHERVTGTVATNLMQLHHQVTWKARHWGWPFTLKVQITEIRFARHFVDEVVSGPFKWMRHYHQFRQKGTGTLMIDEFAFQPPLSWLGKLVNRLLSSYLRALLIKRNQYIKQLAETTP